MTTPRSDRPDTPGVGTIGAAIAAILTAGAALSDAPVVVVVALFVFLALGLSKMVIDLHRSRVNRMNNPSRADESDAPHRKGRR